MVRAGGNLLFSVNDLVELMEKESVHIYVMYPAAYENDFNEVIGSFENIILKIDLFSGNNDMRHEMEANHIHESFQPDNNEQPQILSFGSYEEIKKKIGKNLRSSIKSKGLNQASAASILGISDAAISNIINGNTSLKIESVAMIEARLGIKKEELLHGIKWDEQAYSDQKSIEDSAPLDEALNKIIGAISRISKEDENNHLAGVVSSIERISGKIGIESTKIILGEIEQLMRKLLNTVDFPKVWFVEEYINLLDNITKVFTSYKPGYETSMKRILDLLDYMQYQNKKNKDHD
ncbi:helix-turn-helix transcriptional regulator [Paenibacillus sp. CGMCC 1.16610]|uniref:Helix-turn-helix domain-containing protein n=1 Tax=Paenibacillus anseongense TaxID=2682845 RepID=A0ABW9UAV8_9BACL|nr:MULTISPECIES: helix-turn-helix transcriptional regulator [Paenibacillus]MBA2938206.1 helix-turn-helix transcriptional regulator [Paenibacillus sp. CGMCC 1.16610]MVQ37264.1 helix-turn-helix domain-containing protein [Paenibacillus anseongense]